MPKCLGRSSGVMLLLAHTPCMSGRPSGVRGTVHPAALLADWPARDTLTTSARPAAMLAAFRSRIFRSPVLCSRVVRRPGGDSSPLTAAPTLLPASKRVADALELRHQPRHA